MTILYICIGILIGSCILYLLLRPKLKITEQQNIAIINKNQQLEIENENLESMKKNREELLNNVEKEWFAMNAKREEIKKAIEDLRETQTTAANEVYKSALEVAQNSFDKEINRINSDLEERRIEVDEIYSNLQKEAVQDFEAVIETKQKEFSYWNNRITALQKDVQTALEAAQRKMEMETKQDYYRICLSDEDIDEIKRLREVLPFLRDKTPLNKVIYKVYYEKPLTDMIGRVIGSGTHTGIYKITNIQNQMCYVGQAADLATRWKQHAKRGVGAEDWTQNKLYPAMYAVGVENFTFEVIEECKREELNEREKYWTAFFHAQDFGYSIRSG